MSRETMIKIGVGAAALFLLAFILLELFSGDDDGSSDEAAPTVTQVAVQPSVPFAPPEVPPDAPLEEPTIVPAEQWDPLVRDLIPFIEEARGLRFKEPVAIEVGTAAELLQRYGTPGLDPVTADYLNDILGMYRSLGIYEGSADLNSLVSADLSWGVNQYDPTTKTVTITSDAGGPDAVAFRQAVLVHEMVHALQDQHFGEASPISFDELTMRRMMWEGDAVRIETEFAATMSEADRASYEALEASLRRSSDQGIIEVLGVEGQFIYLGGHQVTRLAQVLDSTKAIDRLVAYPPDRPAQLLSVSTLFLHEGQPWANDTAMPDYPVPEDGLLIDGGSLGAWLWYVAMSTHIDPVEALRAAEAIGSDRYVLFERNGQICANFEAVATDQGGAGHLATGIRNWAATLPHAPAVTVADRSVRVESCDPGVGASMNFARPPQEVVSGPIARVGAVADVLAAQRGWWAEDPLKERQRWCLAETVQRAIPVDEALAGLSPERIASIGEAAVKACLADRVPGGPPPIAGECSAAGMEPEFGQTTLPAPVAEARAALAAAAVACDYGALRELMGAQGPFLGDGLLGQVERPAAVIERWQRLEERERPVLAELVTTLQGGWMCGPELLTTVEGASGDGCAFLSAGSGAVDDNAWVALFDTEGAVIGFASNGAVQGAVLEMWAETVTGERNKDSYTIGGAQGASGLPRGWPVSIPPSSLLEEL
jgi:hypothetical protein